MKTKQHVDDKPYVVRVLEMPVHRTFEVPGALVDEWLRGLPMRDALGAANPDPEAGHGVAELDLYADGTHVFANGTFTGWQTVACSRCVGPARIELHEELRVTFMPESEMPRDEDEERAIDKGPVAGATGAGDSKIDKKRAEKKAAAKDAAREAEKSGKGGGKPEDDGAEVVAEDLDLFPFDGERVDLEPLLREQFVLSVPYAPLCREDCKGLCAQCGVDKNVEACKCEKPIDPRLAALKGLKLPS